MIQNLPVGVLLGRWYMFMPALVPDSSSQMRLIDVMETARAFAD